MCSGKISHPCEYVPVYSEFPELCRHFQTELREFYGWGLHVTSWRYKGFFGQFQYGEHITHSLDAQFLEHRTVEHVETVPCGFLAREYLHISLSGGSKYACFDECAFPSSQVVSCLQCHVEVLLYLVLECSSHVGLHEYWLEHEEGKIICTSGHSTMCRWSSPFPVYCDWLLAQEWLC